MRDELHQLIQRAHRTRRARARLIVDDCLAQLPHYRGLPSALLDEIHASTLHHLTLLYRVTLETGRPLTPEDLDYSRQLARKRAAQGVPLGEFLTFFLVGLTRAWEHLIASAGDASGLRDQLLDRVSAVISNQTQLMTALTEAYVEERERLSRFREQDVDDFVQLLLADEALESVLEARARALGIAPEVPRSVAIFGLPALGRSPVQNVEPEDLRRCLAAGLPDAEVWVGRSREGFVALLPAEPEPEALASAQRDLFGGAEGRVGVGCAARDVGSLRRSAREALRTLHIATSLGGPQRVRSYAELAVLDLVGIDSARAQEFMRGVLGSLARAGASRSYLETLRQLSAHNYRIKLAAAELSIHPHTLSYRVKQIHRRFGLDLEDPEVRLRVQLALLILDAKGPAPDVRPARGGRRIAAPRPAQSRR